MTGAANTNFRSFRCLASAYLAMAALVGHAQHLASPGADLFSKPAIHQIRIELPPGEVERLDRSPREFQPATIYADDVTYREVGIHLKGSRGSFRPLSDKPALTLDFSRFVAGQNFHGLRRVHLNNSVEDPSYLNELLGGELFRSAGVPAPRVTHARVILNGRPLGLYVLIEGFTEDFLRGHYHHIGGDLYEPEPGQDIDGQMKRNSVEAPTTGRKALKLLGAAAREPEPAQRWQSLQETLDVDRFATFMSLEVMLSHRDGYCLARNNFRVYHDLDTDRIVFLPHGMDQLFGPADLPWMPQMSGLVAQAFLGTTEGRKLYIERFSTLFTNVLNKDRLSARIDELLQQLRPGLSGTEFAEWKTEATRLKDRIAQRQLSVQAQLARVAAPTLNLAAGGGRLQGWARATEPTSGKMASGQAPDGIPALSISMGSPGLASWTTQARLVPGRYRFVGRVQTAGVKPLPYGQHQGAGLRVEGSVRTAPDCIGDSNWRWVGTDFEVKNTAEEVTFICELRASAGVAWFELGSLRVVPQ